MILKKIVDAKIKEVARMKETETLAQLEIQVADAPPVRSMRESLNAASPFGVIAEVKFRSPSAGVIRENFEPVSIAESYQGAGAAGISVLTDAEFFGGSFLYLQKIRRSVVTPLLCKDFFVDPYQLYVARRFGADCILLIVAALGQDQLLSLLATARQLGMEALVEVHDSEELSRALDSGAQLIGVNNRDLKTFKTTIDTSLDLADSFPAEVTRISESGINEAQDIRRLRKAGYRGFLIGEHLMRAADPGHELSVLLKRGAM